ncbi:MAG: response regulator [Peptococcaceae bacterium]|nr:response regulator [Peptococcaceae bacterium]
MEKKRKFIILVDNDLVSLKIGTSVLEGKYAVATAPSTKKLFFLLEKRLPDLILLDVEMPEMNGYETIKIIKERPETRDIPVIFLTGKNNQDCKCKGFSLGALDYFIKPIDPPVLLKSIEAHLFHKDIMSTNKL